MARRQRAAMQMGRTDWYRIQNAAGSDTADVMIYDEIGWFGVTSEDFMRDLSAITAKKINLRINSPGGFVDEALAIYNAIRDHPAMVTATVDGMAASAASFIFQAGDMRIMNRNTQLMIHQPYSGLIGTAQDMRAEADLLDRHASNIAAMYAERSGVDAAKWLKAMEAETWYFGQEAVDAGLADEAIAAPKPQPDGPDKTEDLMTRTWNVAGIYRYANRTAAPRPPIIEPEYDVAGIRRALQEAFA